MNTGDLGERIRHFREVAGLSQRDLANLMQVTQAAVSCWERGVAAPQHDKLAKLAQCLDCLVADLVPDLPKKLAA